jgi:guanylate kinase
MILRYPASITIFIVPPSKNILKARLIGRGTDSNNTIQKRLINAEKEMAQKDLYSHVIINNVLDVALNELEILIEKYRSGDRGLPFYKKDA